MSDFEIYKDPNVEKLSNKIYEILQNEEPEIAISALVNLLQIALYAFALETGMDSEQFVVYVNKLMNEMKKELFKNSRLEQLDNFNEENPY